MDVIAFFEQYWYAIIGSAGFAVFIAYHYRRLKTSAASNLETNTLSNARKYLLSILLWGAVVVVFIWNRLYGYRVIGLICIGYGLWILITRRVPYGWEGRPPSGQITGAIAIVLGIVQMALGFLLLLAPNMINAYLSSYE